MTRVGGACEAVGMNMNCAPGGGENGWAVVDVETTGLDPAAHRVISVAALALAPDCTVTDQFATLLDPGVDPGPVDVHGLTSDILAGSPHFADVAGQLASVLRGRTMVAHFARFDYGFLAAEAQRAGVDLPVSTVMCTGQLARNLRLATENLRLATLAKYWGIPQSRPHDAFDDAMVLAQILPHALQRARDIDLELPITPPPAALTVPAELTGAPAR